MNATYKRLTATALRLIAKYGAKVTWRQPADPTTDSEKPWNATPNPPRDYTPSIAFFPDGNKTFAALMNGTDVPAGAEVGYMGAVAFEPQVGDIVIRNGSDMRVVSITPIQPDGTPILYTIGFEN